MTSCRISIDHQYWKLGIVFVDRGKAHSAFADWESVLGAGRTSGQTAESGEGLWLEFPIALSATKLYLRWRWRCVVSTSCQATYVFHDHIVCRDTIRSNEQESLAVHLIQIAYLSLCDFGQRVNGRRGQDNLLTVRHCVFSVAGRFNWRIELVDGRIGPGGPVPLCLVWGDGRSSGVSSSGTPLGSSLTCRKNSLKMAMEIRTWYVQIYNRNNR